MRENAESKARRYLAEGRLTVRLLTPRRVEANCRGSLGETYRLTLTKELALCGCPARGRCAHLIALTLVCNRPNLGGTR